MTLELKAMIFAQQVDPTHTAMDIQDASNSRISPMQAGRTNSIRFAVSVRFFSMGECQILLRTRRFRTGGWVRSAIAFCFVCKTWCTNGANIYRTPAPKWGAHRHASVMNELVWFWDAWLSKWALVIAKTNASMQ